MTANDSRIKNLGERMLAAADALTEVAEFFPSCPACRFDAGLPDAADMIGGEQCCGTSPNR